MVGCVDDDGDETGDGVDGGLKKGMDGVAASEGDGGNEAVGDVGVDVSVCESVGWDSALSSSWWRDGDDDDGDDVTESGLSDSSSSSRSEEDESDDGFLPPSPSTSRWSDEAARETDARSSLVSS